MRLRTIRRAAERAAKALAAPPVPVVPRTHDVRRQVWHQQAGAPDKKAAVDLVGVDFGFKEDDGCVASPSAVSRLTRQN